MSNFALHTAPFSVQVTNYSTSLYRAVSELYPSVVFDVPGNNTIYDFSLQVKRKFAGWGRPYHVSAGDQHFRMSDTAQLLPVFEWGINWCVASYQHRYLAIHAAVLEKNGQALIMPAPPGSGKSTLCAVMMLNGWRLLSDEMCLVDLISCMLVPYVRPLSLKNQSLDVIKHHYPNADIRQITTGTTKGTVGYLLPSEASWQQYTQSAQPAWVVFPKYNSSCAELNLTRLISADAFMHLANNSFNYTVLAVDGFNALAKLVKGVNCFRLEYADIDQAITELNRLC